MKKNNLYRMGAAFMAALMVITCVPQTSLYAWAEEETPAIAVSQEEQENADGETVQQPAEPAVVTVSPDETDTDENLQPQESEVNPNADEEPIELESISFNVSSLTLDRAKNQTKAELKCTPHPEGADLGVVTFESDNEDVIKVTGNGDTAVVTALSFGKATITATTGDKKAECAVEALEIPVEKVEISPEELSMKKGGTAELKVTIQPDNADRKGIKLKVIDSSADDKIATLTVSENISNNVISVTANAVGRAFVTATSENNERAYDTCEIVVNDVDGGSVALEKLVQNPNYPKSLLPGSSIPLRQYISFKPANTTERALTWSIEENKTTAGSGDSDYDPNDYAEVDEETGVVTAKWKEGDNSPEREVKIVAASAKEDGEGEADDSNTSKKVVFNIKIKRSHVPLTALYAEPAKLTLEDDGKKKQQTIRVQLEPLRSTEREITATVSNEAATIASADEPGQTAAKTATATADKDGWVSFVVTAKKLDGKKKQDTCKITFTKKSQTTNQPVTSGIRAVCDVTINQYVEPVEDLRFILDDPSQEILEIKDGETKELTAVITPLEAEDPSIVWNVGNAEIVSILKVVTEDEDGSVVEKDIAADGKVKAEPVMINGEKVLASTVKIQANMVGECPITATAAGDITAECKVTVTENDNPATDLKIVSADDRTKEITEITLKKGQRYKLVPNVTVKDNSKPANKKVRWVSSSPAVAGVAKEENAETGVVTANETGECTITANASGKSENCTKTVVVHVENPLLVAGWKGDRKILTYKPADQPITEDKLRKELEVFFYPRENPIPKDDKLTLVSDEKDEKYYTLKILREDGKTEKNYEPSDLVKPATRILVVSYNYEGITYKQTVVVEMEKFDKADLISVAPLGGDNADIWNVPNATPADSLPLPKTTEITVGRMVIDEGVTKTITAKLDAEIVWNVDDSGYDPNIAEKQDFKVNGTVVCPAYVSNPNKISLNVQAEVHVRERADSGKKMPRPTFIVLGGEAVGDRTAVTLPYGTKIELQSPVEGAEIYYMVDRRPDEERGVPHDETHRYKSPIAISAKTTTVYAVAVKDGYYDSDCSECTIKLKNEDPVDPDDPNAGPLPDQVTEEDRAQIGGRVPDGLWVVVQKEANETNGFAYTGSAIKPAVHVYDRTVLLTEKKDYTLAYSNNVNAGNAVGSANPPTITVTGKGNYEGKAVVHFTIKPQNIEDDAVLVDQYLAAAYNGKAQKPNPSLTWNGKKLTKNKDYTYGDMSYTEAGIYKFIVTGIGNYTGSRMMDFEIYQGGVPASKLTVSKISNYQYTGKEIKPAVEVKYKNTRLFAGTEDSDDGNYWIKYENCTNVGTASVVIVGKGNYKGAKRINFKILPKASIAKAGITLSDIPPAGVAYTGKPYTPKCVVNYLGETLKEGRDYKLDYQNNVNAGTATVVITGMGAYNGTAKKSFKILQNNISGLTAVMDASYVYEKGGCKPKPKVTCNGIELKEGTDYTLAYKNNNKIGNTAYVTVKGKGNYKGQIVRYFEIAMQDIGNLKVVAKDKVYQRKNNIYKTTVQVIDKNGKALSAGTDYSRDIYYTYEGGDNAGKPVLASDIIPAGTVIGVDIRVANPRYYHGTIHGTYRIVQSDISEAKVSIEPQEYTGRSIRLQKSQIQITFKGVPLGINDYEIVGYENNVNQGNAKITIRGVGGYGGTKTVTFKIKKMSILNLKY